MFDKVVYTCPECFEEHESVVSGVAGTGGVYRLEEVYPDDEVLYPALQGESFECGSCGYKGVVQVEQDMERLTLSPSSNEV